MDSKGNGRQIMAIWIMLAIICFNQFRTDQTLFDVNEYLIEKGTNDISFRKEILKTLEIHSECLERILDQINDESRVEEKEAV